MIDPGIVEQFFRSKFSLQDKLSEIGQIPGGSEIESQMMFVETRMEARLKQAVRHGTEELTALKLLLIEVSKPNGCQQ